MIRNERELAVKLANAVREHRLQEQKEELERSLYRFLQEAWHVFDPSDFIPNWHIESIAEHLEAVACGNIRRLLINVPPRTGKTNLVSVCFPAWVWAQRESAYPLMGPTVSFFYASYAESLSLEHSLKTRRLIESSWYKERWGMRFKLVSDRNTRHHFENSKGGYRMTTSVDARGTGFGADILVADDPHMVQEAESEKVRNSVTQWWTETMPSRLNDRRTGAMIVVMQRVHEEDLSGIILARDLGYTHLCIPMEYERVAHINGWDGNEIKTYVGEEVNEVEEVFWEDQRTEDGELLWEKKFPQSEIDRIKREGTAYAWSSQFQQNPEPRGGGIIKRDYWQVYDHEVSGQDPSKSLTYPPFEFVIASLDTAYTEKEENDYSAFTIWGIWREKKPSLVPIPGGRPIEIPSNPKIMLMFAWQERLQLHDLVKKVNADCARFKVDRIVIEDKAAGHSVSQELRRLFGVANYGIELFNPRLHGDKVARVHAVVHLFSEGLIYAPAKDWSQTVINACAIFPYGAHDDLVDSTSMGLIYMRKTGLLIRREEWQREEDQEYAYKPKSQPLYET